MAYQENVEEESIWDGVYKKKIRRPFYLSRETLLLAPASL